MRREREALPEAAPKVVPVKLEAVEGCDGLFRVPSEPKHGGPGEIPPGFVETYHPVHGRLMVMHGEVPGPAPAQEVTETPAGE